MHKTTHFIPVLDSRSSPYTFTGGNFCLWLRTKGSKTTFDRVLETEPECTWFIVPSCTWSRCLYSSLSSAAVWTFEPFPFVCNSLLIVFSTIGFVRTFNETGHIYSRHGTAGLACHPLTLNGPNFLWMYLFSLSRVVEFRDTFLLILKQRLVIFLRYKCKWIEQRNPTIFECFQFREKVKLSDGFEYLDA